MPPTPAGPATVTIDPDVDRRFVIIRIAGTLTLEVAIDAQQKVVRDFGLARMFGSLAQARLDVRPAVFRDEAAAIAWITATP